MPWDKAHKKETRNKILDAAAAAFRKGGISAVSVGEVMDGAGLTHGGFYAHFKSKDDLVAEALLCASDQMRERHAGSNGIKAVVEQYLSKSHFDHPEWGCPMAALGPELVRGSARVRRTFGTTIERRLEQLKSLLTSGSREQREREAAGALACMVGAMILARGLGDERGLEFLAECRSFLRGALDASPERSIAD